MKKRILRYLIHIFSTIAVLLLIGFLVLLSENGAIHYGDNPARMNWENDGPYIFFENDSTLNIQYIKGNQDDGFHVTTNKVKSDSSIVTSCYFNLDEMNEIIRSRYHKGYFPREETSDEQILTSTKTGPAWYRGYFKDEVLNQDEVETGLKKFNVNAVVVGHTIQSKVKSSFDGKVIGIDVQHPKDFHKNWPKRESEALIIENGEYYRVFVNGTKEKI